MNHWIRKNVDFGIQRVESPRTGKVRFQVRMRVPGGTYYKQCETFAEAVQVRDDKIRETGRPARSIQGSNVMTDMWLDQARERLRLKVAAARSRAETTHPR